ncbi:MAG: thioredoxin domain-containing protein [Patescibacteria group bacterium]|nr:thioredoxin domain-containing protein [Patescibacteria group bacterium]
MNSEEQIRKFFLIGTGILLVLIVGGLIWAIMSNPGTNDKIDPNITFNDNQNPALGPSDAKVTVRIYSDFQCPACKVAESVLTKIMDEYQDRVRFIWNDMPLTQIHQNAVSAAVAARCADEQGRFWESNAMIFETQDTWAYKSSPQDHFISIANELGLNEDKYSQCLLNDQIMSLVESDFQEAVSMGLTGTPTFFINRKMLVGAMDANAWRTELDTALAN